LEVELYNRVRVLLFWRSSKISGSLCRAFACFCCGSQFGSLEFDSLFWVAYIRASPVAPCDCLFEAISDVGFESFVRSLHWQQYERRAVLLACVACGQIFFSCLPFSLGFRLFSLGYVASSAPANRVSNRNCVVALDAWFSSLE